MRAGSGSGEAMECKRTTIHAKTYLVNDALPSASSVCVNGTIRAQREIRGVAGAILDCSGVGLVLGNPHDHDVVVVHKLQMNLVCEV